MRKASAVETGTKYKSKIDRAFYIKAAVVCLIGVILLAIYFIFHHILVGFLGTWMFVALLLIFLPEYKSTYYVVRNSSLFIRNGLFEKVTILYRQMMEVAEEKGEPRDGSSVVALSKDRVYIRYRVKKKEYWLEISPENKEQFLAELHEKRVAMPNRKKVALAEAGAAAEESVEEPSKETDVQEDGKD